jgi:hypothetical protein
MWFALGLVIPVLAPKPVTPPAGTVVPPGLLLVNRRDEIVRRWAMAVLFFGTLLWLATVYLSIGGKWPQNWIGLYVDQKFWIGLILYIVAFVSSESTEEERSELVNSKVQELMKLRTA